MRKNHPVLRGREKHHLNLLRLDAEIARETLERHKRETEKATEKETASFRQRLFAEVKRIEGETRAHISGQLD